MSAAPLSKELAEEALRAFGLYGTKAEAARQLGIHEATFKNRLKAASRYGLTSTNPVMEGFEIARVSTQQDENGSVTKRYITQKPERGDNFTMPEGQVIKGVSALVDADGRTIQQWIKTRTDDVTPVLTEVLKKVFAEYEGKSPVLLVPPSVFPRKQEFELMSVYPIADQHNGLLSWGKETGESYDLAIGVKRLRDCMKRLVAQSPCSHRAIILNLGDWQHNDDQRNITPGHNHQLDVDSRYFKILTAGVHLMMDCIDLALQKHKEVLVRNIPGNHDPHASIALTVALKAFYHNNPRVTIDDNPGDFFYYRFGQTLIGATHGHKLKPEKMAMAMAVTQRKDWGETKYHWFMFGHIHHETAKEVGDCRVESFQTLAAKDAYAVGGGYVAGQSLQSITLHVEDGEVGRHRVNIFPATERKA